MAFQTFRRTERSLTVMTTTAEFALVYVIHLHAGAALFELKDRGMAAVASEHSGMELMAEDRRFLIAGWIREFFLECSHLMALCAVCRGKGLLPVMTIPAGIALIHQVHGYFGSPLLHVEEFGVTFAAGIFLGMALVRKNNRHPGPGEGEVRQVMAAIADVLVQISFFMGLYNMTLVAVHAETYVF
jgi:hypothetical protein